jgi:uncharacterized Fe-S cluster-containing radical SAM superfamily protein
MYNPVELSKKIEQIVVQNNLKKYYRFRPTGFYGGIATADTVGCNLRCKFCWSSNSVWNENITGEFYSSKKIAETLQHIAATKGYHQVRISGGEPTIGKNHLIEVLEQINPTTVFILETNGILLGYDTNYVENLSRFKNLHVRVCLKGADAKEYSLFTGAETGFEYQLKALQYLQDAHINFNIAVVSPNHDKKQTLFQRLKEMNLENIRIEEEEITLYPLVKNRLQKENLLHYFE